MTLVLASVTRGAAILVADRLYSAPSGAPGSGGEYAKLGFIQFRDAVVASTICGLSVYGNLFLWDWFLERVADAAAPEHTLVPTLERVREDAQDAFKLIQARDKRICWVVVGFTYDGRGLILLLSNFKKATAEDDLAEASHEFFLTGMRETEAGKGQLVAGYGLSTAIEENARQRLRTAVREDGSDIRGVSVDVIREVAAVYPNAVSSNCMSIFIPRAGGEAEALYHPAEASAYVYGPDRVEARGGEHGVLVFSGDTRVPGASGFIGSLPGVAKRGRLLPPSVRDP